MKTMWEKEKMLVTSIFSFSYNVFLPIRQISSLLPQLLCHLPNAKPRHGGTDEVSQGGKFICHHINRFGHTDFGLSVCLSTKTLTLAIAF